MSLLCLAVTLVQIGHQSVNEACKMDSRSKVRNEILQYDSFTLKNFNENSSKLVLIKDILKTFELRLTLLVKME